MGAAGVLMLNGYRAPTPRDPSGRCLPVMPLQVPGNEGTAPPSTAVSTKTRDDRAYATDTGRTMVGVHSTTQFPRVATGLGGGRGGIRL